jgi:hypothetical protein
MLTGLLRNLLLLSYFMKETGAVIVHILGVISTYVVIMQLAMATSVIMVIGLLLNFLNYFGWIPGTLWLLWEGFIIVGGLVVLPQVTILQTQLALLCYTALRSNDASVSL